MAQVLTDLAAWFMGVVVWERVILYNVSMPKGYPLFVNLAGQPVLIVGGGAVGLRKAEGLVAAGAAVTVASVAFAEGFAGLNGCRLVRGGYASALMREARWRLVFAATNDAAVNELVGRDAAAAGVWCCRCDEAEAGDFWGGATIEEGPVTIAISTGGASPVLSGKIRDACAGAISPHWPRWAALLTTWRERVLAEVPEVGTRRELLKRMAGDEIEALLKAGDEAGAEQRVAAWMAAAKKGAVRD